MHYLRLNHARRLTMEEICAAFHCSPSYVSHRFKEQTGMTVHRYLTRLRVENAARLLRASRLNMTEIALATGFEGSNYFSHVFRAEMGCSPKAYRAATREEQA
jgi:two-component system response regulator YesN